MKIIIVGTAYPLRGAFAQLNATLAWHLSKKHSVEIVSFKRQYPKLLFPGKTQIDPSKRLFDVPTKALIDSINPFSWISAARYIRQQRPDVLIFRYWIPFFAPCFGVISSLTRNWTKARILFICDNILPHERRPGDVALARFAFRFADYFLVHSRSVGEDLNRFVRNPKYVLAPLPIDSIFGKPIAKLRARKLLSMRDQKIILFFGYVRRYKGLHHLLEAMPKILERFKLKLLIVGEFYEEEERYKKQITDLGITQSVVMRSEYVTNEEVGVYFSACDVVVLPYVSATQSAVVPVAYYFDKPVITTDVGGLAEDVANGKTGIIVPPGRPDMIADAVIQYYTKNKEKSFAPNVKKAKKRHGWPNYVASIEELIQ